MPYRVIISADDNYAPERQPSPSTASVSQSQEPSLVDASFKGRRKKPDAGRQTVAAAASQHSQPLLASSTGVHRSKRLKKEDKKKNEGELFSETTGFIATRIHSPLATNVQLLHLYALFFGPTQIGRCAECSCECMQYEGR
uniref:Uncharacterized protein n=1 Tax=Trichuris muris TaxID=70415 RepID=A0A5S6R3R7_TRIMR